MAVTSVTLQRMALLADELRSNGIDLLVAAPSADMVYLAGLARHASERAVLLVLQSNGTACLVVPALESPGATVPEEVHKVVYAEDQDPFDLLRTTIATAKIRRIAISNQAWASVLLRLQRAFPEAEFVSAEPVLRGLRMAKSADEIELLARAGAMADRAFAAIVQLRFAGRTELQLQRDLAGLLSKEGLAGWDHGPIVASGPNGASPHHTAGDRQIHEGDGVVMDFGGTLENYQADITRTVHVGTPSDEFRRVYEVVTEAQQAGVDSVRPGTLAEDVDAAARQVIAGADLGEYFIHRTGHGVGLEVHEQPYIIAGNTLALEPGMAFSVEPGVYLPGKFGIRIEDIVVVTETGVRRLNNAPRDLVIVH